MSSRISSAWTAVIAVLLAGSICAFAGYGIGLAMTLNSAQNSLFKYAANHSLDFERPPTEAHQVLAEVNASPYPPCSESELDYFRLLILKSHFIKDVGRMLGDQLRCSATVSRERLPTTKYLPSFIRPDGTAVYIKMNAFPMGGQIPIVIRTGDAYAAMDPYNRNAMPTAVQFTLSSKTADQDKSYYLGGNRTDLPSYVLVNDTAGRIHGTLYATHCSGLYPSCITLYLPLKAAVMEQRHQIALCVAIGGLVGGSFGMMGLLLYRRKKGIEQQLRRAIKRNVLKVVYQPLVDITTRKVTGAEALLRWTDEDNLVIPPDVFIKIAEKRGFVDQITKLVVRCVLADFGQYLAEHPEFHINVNVTATDLTDPAFRSMLDDALAAANLSANALGIEITESATAAHKEAIDTIAHLRHRGHVVYIDDFGTGYSSLAYLKDLGVDGIKIDRAFTLAIDTNSVTSEILPQIVAMAEALKLNVIAEGIETEAQYAYYRAMAHSLTAQGWLFGDPVSWAEFQFRYLASEKPLLR